MNVIKDLEGIIEIICDAKSIAVLTGAGVSAESGIRTFRDPDGFWAKLNPAELASANGFIANRQLVWDWYQERRAIIAECQPNAGHFAIAKLEALFDDFTLITQNVDRLHQSAGSRNVLELHGNIIDNHCFDCGQPYEEAIDPREHALPDCGNCGGRIRPSVVWFGEMLPEYEMEQAVISAQKSDVFFTIGTSAEVYPAANLPLIAKDAGANVIEINPNQTAISSYMDYVLRMTSAQAMPVILEEIIKRKQK
jgi:NAD-dependent deacetylase